MRLTLRLPRRDRTTDVESTLPVCPRWRSAERWTRRHLGDVQHEHRVTRIATRLFDLTRPMHGLNSDDLRLLQTAAMVHDVGRSMCDETHHIDGAQLILSDGRFAGSRSDRRRLAYLTRYHKGKVPQAGRDEILDPSDDHDRLLHLLALLRSADALDSRKLASPRLVFAMARDFHMPRLRVTCYLEEECLKTRKVYSRRKKFRLLEERFDCRVEIDITHASGLALVG